jgi:hypothetical protein
MGASPCDRITLFGLEGLQAFIYCKTRPIHVEIPANYQGFPCRLFAKSHHSSPDAIRR